MLLQLGIERMVDGHLVGLVRVVPSQHLKALRVLSIHLTNVNISAALNIRLYR